MLVLLLLLSFLMLLPHPSLPPSLLLSVHQHVNLVRGSQHA